MELKNILLSAGIPASIKGFRFIQTAVELVKNDPEMIEHITTKLYPSIAATHDTTSSKVECAIRHAVLVASNNGGLLKLNTMLGIDIFKKGETTTNSAFIALLATTSPVDATNPVPAPTSDKTHELIGKLTAAALGKLDAGDLNGALQITAQINELKAS